MMANAQKAQKAGMMVWGTVTIGSLAFTPLFIETMQTGATSPFAIIGLINAMAWSLWMSRRLDRILPDAHNGADGHCRTLMDSRFGRRALRQICDHDKMR